MNPKVILAREPHGMTPSILSVFFRVLPWLKWVFFRKKSGRPSLRSRTFRDTVSRGRRK